MGGPANHLLSNDLSTDIGQGRGTATLAQSLKRTAFQNGGDPDKALSLAFKRIRLLCDTMGLQKKHYDTACELYKQVSDAKVVKGRTIASVVPAIVFIACRVEQNPSGLPLRQVTSSTLQSFITAHMFFPLQTITLTGHTRNIVDGGRMRFYMLGCRSSVALCTICIIGRVVGCAYLFSAPPPSRQRLVPL